MIFTKILFAIALTCLSSLTWATENTPPPTTVETQTGFNHMHPEWSLTLKNFVVVKGASSQVRYKALKENPQTLLSYLKTIEAVTPEMMSSWSDPQKIAFWINAYNAYTLKLIVDHYPVKSIKDIGGFFSSPWKKEFFKLLGQSFHLDKIEHEILRKKFKEPRIHFAVNCASIGCPALRSEAYTADQLSNQLQEQGQIFLQDRSRNSWDASQNKLFLSPIFKWFKEDFGSEPNNILSFVKPFFKSDSAPSATPEFKLEYTDYDWSLNDIR
jgi:hypothetical protein